MNVSTATWKGAIDHAERLVILAERKMPRQRNDQAMRVARLKVTLTATQTLILSLIVTQTLILTLTVTLTINLNLTLTLTLTLTLNIIAFFSQNA